MKTISIKGRIIPLLVTGLCMLFLVPNNVIAQDKQVKNVRTVRVEAKEVNQGKKVAKLTDEQKAKMKDLRLEHMKAIQSLKAQSQELTAHLKSLNLAEKPDNKAIFKTIDELTANHGEMMKRMVSFKQAIKAILTPEQLKEMELRGMNNHFQKGRHFQMRGQQGNRNFGRGQMMQRGGMNRPGQMMQHGQMQQRQMMMQRQMMNRQGGQGFGGGQMMPQGQMQKRFQIIRQGQHPVSDSTKTK